MDEHRIDDLVLPPVMLDQIRDLVTASRNEKKLYERAGSAGRIKASSGISALFSGASGTGKRTAAKCVASALGRNLYRVDLHSIVSRYIGETEKNINAVFDEAQDRKSVLLFDEADALFGKRTEVDDFQDRETNFELAHILQKTEVFNRLAILITNRRLRTDEAFMRRFRFVIDFPRPNKAMREVLWMRMIPPDFIETDVDFAFLVRNFDLTGGDIRNIVSEALLRSEDETGARITMELLVKTIERQKTK